MQIQNIEDKIDRIILFLEKENLELKEKVKHYEEELDELYN